MNSKKEHAKKDLRLAYSQGHMTAYPPNIKAMARYLSTQYPNNKPANQRNGKKGDKKGRWSEIRNPKTKIVTRVTLQVHPLEIPQQKKNPLLLAEELVPAFRFQKKNVQLSHPLRTVEEIVEAQPMNDDVFLGWR